MTSTSEISFGAKLRKAQDLLAYLSGFTGYNPPRQQETIKGLETLIDDINHINAAQAGELESYRLTVAQRQKAFSKDPYSLEKILSPIKGAVEAQYGKQSPEAATLNTIIKKMRAAKITKAPADPTKTEKTISQSQQSYGSLTMLFNNILNTVAQYPNYVPSNENITVTGLKKISDRLTELNNDVAQKVQQLKKVRAMRTEKYNELADSVQRIKAYVKAQYGINSDEYKLIKGIRI